MTNLLTTPGSSKVLPVMLQDYLWQLVVPSLKAKLSPGSYESSYVALERVIYGNKTKELRELRIDVYKAISEIPRWTFVRGSLPYVIQCCTAILEQRRQLGLTDNFSVPVTKLFYTLHWILIEASEECCLDNVPLDLKTIELFIINIIPLMHNLHTSDLTFSLETGLFLWQPLWNHMPPLNTLLAIPVVVPKSTDKKRNLTPSLSLSVERPDEATFFDIAVIKVLAMDDWCFMGYKWGLRYIEKYLINYFDSFGMEMSYSMHVMNKYSPNKNLSFLDSHGEVRQNSPKAMKKLNIFPKSEKSKQKKELTPETVPDDLLHYVTKRGHLRLTNVLKVVGKLSKNNHVNKLGGNILFVHSLLIEIALNGRVKSDIMFYYHDLLLATLVNIIKNIGCEFSCLFNDTRGIKGDQYRLIMHEYMNRLIQYDKSKSKSWFKKYVSNESPKEVIAFLHAFTNFCRNTIATSQENLQFRFEAAASFESETQSKEFLELQKNNEKIIIGWITHVLYEQITEKWLEMNQSENTQCFNFTVQLTKYIQTEHRWTYQKLVMMGLLNSFTKQSVSEKEEHDGKQGDISHEQSVSDASPKMPEIVIKAKGLKNAKKKFMIGRLATKIEEDVTLQVGSYPELSSLSDGLSESLPSSDYSKSLPKSFSSGSLRKKSLFSDAVNKAKSMHERKMSEKQRGRLVNVLGLYKGMRQLRCLFELTDIGSSPDETAIAAMLDLEAPAIARAAFLIEVAHFVHKCNKNDWSSLIKFSHANVNSRGHPSQFNSINYLKHRAGIYFHKWGVAIGKKLDDILTQEKQQCDGAMAREESFDLMYEGDVSAVSSKCPEALKFVACQLLCEITAYLRETFVTVVTLQITSQSSVHTDPKQRLEVDSPAPSLARKPRHSIAAGIAKKISAVHQKKTSLGILFPPGQDFNTEESSGGSPGKSFLSQSRAYANKRSPKVTRKYSRSFSKASLQQSLSVNAAMLSEDHDDVPDEMIDFPWLDVIIELNQTSDFLCAHSGDVCKKLCPVEQARSCSDMLHALITFYEVACRDYYQDKDEKVKEEDSVLFYLKNNVLSLPAAPYAALCKGVFVMEDLQQLAHTMSTSWEVLLYPDQHLKSAAASLFLVAAYKLEQAVASFLEQQLMNRNVSDREKALQRFAVLWDNQLEVYRHLEESAKITLRLPMLKLDYTLPSREIGEEAEEIPDAPWQPVMSSAIEFELSDEEEETYFIADSELQKKTKLKSRAKKLKSLREKFMISSVSYANVASVDFVEQEEDDAVVISTSQSIKVPFFPQAMGKGILNVVALLDDTAMTGVSNLPVNILAAQLIWRFMLDWPETFFQRFFEKITKIKLQDELIFLLRKLFTYMPLIPREAAQMLLNHLIGVIIYYDRTNKIGSHEKIAALLPLLPPLIASIPKISLVDMRQSLKRDHAEHIIMVTANVGSVKEVNVVYANQKERLAIPDEMTFAELLHQCKGLFDLDNAHYMLVNKHSGMIMELNNKIRDVFVYKRGFPNPTLKLEQLDKSYIQYKMQQQVLTKKLRNISMLNLASAIFESSPTKKHETFLYTELYQQSSFPKKAIDLEFDLCLSVDLGKEIFGVDVLLKDAWVRFINNLLVKLAEQSQLGEEAIGLFLDPINGALLLHAEDVVILRTSLAALISIVRSYGKTFALDGYHVILPTMLRVYSLHEDNLLVKNSIEFTAGQFFRIHQSPFLLQLFASVAPHLLPSHEYQAKKQDSSDLVPARCLFSLIESLNQVVPDTLNIMSLVSGDMPIKPHDMLFDDDTSRTNKIDLSIRLALTIIAYKPESNRALQMMYVLALLIPFYLKHLEKQCEQDPTDANETSKIELRQLRQLSKYVNVIIEQNELLINPYQQEGSVISESSAPNMSRGGSSYIWNAVTSSVMAIRNWFHSTGVNLNEADDIERTSIIEEGENPLLLNPVNREESSAIDMFYQPRTVLLTLASDFTLKCLERFTKLSERRGKGKNGAINSTDIIEDDNTLILIDVAITLLKFVYYDHTVLKNQGLQRFLLEAMPCITWSNGGSFEKIVKRINKTLGKLLTRPEYLKYVEWPGFEVLIKGIYLSLKKQEGLAEVPELKCLLHTCTRIMIGDVVTSSFDSEPIIGIASPSSVEFNTLVVKLAARLLFCRPGQYVLQQDFQPYFGNTSVMKMQRFLVHWLLPLCIRMGTGRTDYPAMGSEDIQFVTNLLLANIFPKLEHQESPPLRSNSFDQFTPSMTKSFSFLTHLGVQLGREDESEHILPDICFLGLKILLTVENKSFRHCWRTLRLTIEKYLSLHEADENLWNFLYFVVTTRSPLTLHILPCVKKKLRSTDHLPNNIKTICHRIRHNLLKPAINSCRSSILSQLLNDLSRMSHSEQLPTSNAASSESESQPDGKPFRLREPPVTRVKRHTPRKQYSDGSPVQRSSGSIIKRSLSENHPKERLKKQVSFYDETDRHDDKSDFQMRQASPISKQIKKLSRRSKLRMFKRQASEDFDEHVHIISNTGKRGSVSSEDAISIEAQDHALLPTTSHETFALASTYETPARIPSPVDLNNEASPVSPLDKYVENLKHSTLTRSPVIKRRTTDELSINLGNASPKKVVMKPRLSSILAESNESQTKREVSSSEGSTSTQSAPSVYENTML